MNNNIIWLPVGGCLFGAGIQLPIIFKYFTLGTINAVVYGFCIGLLFMIWAEYIHTKR